MTEPVAPLRRRFVLAGLMSLSALALTSIAQAASNSIFPFIPDPYTFSTQQVQDAVACKFPLQRTASQIFDVVLSHSVVGMAADRNRVTVCVDARLSTPFMPNPVIGAFMLSTQLGYDAPSRSVILVRHLLTTRSLPVTPRVQPADRRGRRATRGATARPLSDPHLQARRTPVRRCVLRTWYNYSPYKRHTCVCRSV